MKIRNAHSSPDDGVQHSSIVPKAISIGCHSKRVEPSDNLATESEEGPVRVYRALLVKHLYGRLQRVDNNEGLAEHVDVNKSTCTRQKDKVRTGSVYQQVKAFYPNGLPTVRKSSTPEMSAYLAHSRPRVGPWAPADKGRLTGAI